MPVAIEMAGIWHHQAVAIGKQTIKHHERQRRPEFLLAVAQLAHIAGCGYNISCVYYYRILNRFPVHVLRNVNQPIAILLILLLLLLKGFIERRIAQRPQVRYVSSGIVNCSHVNRQHTINS